MEKIFKDIIIKLGDVATPRIIYESFELVFDENHAPKVITTLHQYIKTDIKGSEVTHTAIREGKIILSERLLNRTRKDKINIIKTIKEKEMNSFTSFNQNRLGSYICKCFNRKYDELRTIIDKIESKTEQDEIIYGIFCFACCTVGQYIWSKNMRDTCKKYFDILIPYCSVSCVKYDTNQVLYGINRIIDYISSLKRTSFNAFYFTLILDLITSNHG